MCKPALCMALGLWSFVSLAQQRAAPLHSPELHADGRITFRLLAPKASEVFLRADFPKAREVLRKDEKGIWSVTLGPLEADIYGYEFFVDGVRTVDPNNPAVKYTSRPMETSSLVEAPGASTMFYAARPVPHGTVQVRWYHSKSLEMERRLHVYTPPGYEGGSARYPVLYLLHGAGGDDSIWMGLGRMNLVLDNLIADGKISPVVVVMPFGYEKHPTPLKASDVISAENQRTGFERDLLQDVIPLIQAGYRVHASREERAIAGLSMGGGQSLAIGLKHPELFSRVAGFSAGVLNSTVQGLLEPLVSNPQKLNEQFRLLWVACGTADGLFPANKQFSEFLTKRGVKHTFRPSEGGHTWQVWRRNLHEVGPLMFPPKQERASK